MSVIERRVVLKSALSVVAANAIVLQPAAAAASEDIPGIEFAFEALVTLTPAVVPGATPFGGRKRIPITGGTFKGPKIQGQVLPGGADWQLIRADGLVQIEAEYMIQADDGTLIHVYNKGLVIHRSPTDNTMIYARTSPIFEAPIGPHNWLNKAIFVGTLGPAPDDFPKPSVRVRIYRVT